LFKARFSNDEKFFNDLYIKEENDYNLNIATCYCGGYLKTRNYTIVSFNIKMDEKLYKDIDFSDPPGYSFLDKCDR